jgi:hypothetical protein
MSWHNVAFEAIHRAALRFSKSACVMKLSFEHGAI